MILNAKLLMSYCFFILHSRLPFQPEDTIKNCRYTERLVLNIAKAKVDYEESIIMKRRRNHFQTIYISLVREFKKPAMREVYNQCIKEMIKEEEIEPRKKIVYFEYRSPVSSTLERCNYLSYIVFLRMMKKI